MQAADAAVAQPPAAADERDSATATSITCCCGSTARASRRRAPISRRSFPSGDGDFFECTTEEAARGLPHRFAVGGGSVRYRAVHSDKVEDIVALDIALPRNTIDWCETAARRHRGRSSSAASLTGTSSATCSTRTMPSRRAPTGWRSSTGSSRTSTAAAPSTRPSTMSATSIRPSRRSPTSTARSIPPTASTPASARPRSARTGPEPAAANGARNHRPLVAGTCQAAGGASVSWASFICASRLSSS